MEQEVEVTEVKEEGTEQVPSPQLLDLFLGDSYN